MSTQWDAIIVGGGMSGLGAAWWLDRRGLRVAVLEAAPRCGGAIGTARVDEALVELGPNSTLETTPLIGELLEGLGIAGERVYANEAAKNRYVLRGGRLIALPLSPPAFLATPLFSFGTKLGLLREPFVAPAPPGAEETIAEFVRRRLGREFLDYAINPFVAGIYAGSPEKLSVPAAFPRLFELEQKYGSLIRGQIRGARERKRNPEKSKQSAKMFSFRDGMQTLTDALATRLGHVFVHAPVKEIERRESGFAARVETGSGPAEHTARALIVATPAAEAARLVRPLAGDAAAALGEIEYPPVAVAASLYARERIAHALDGFGFLVPEKERRKVLGTIFSSTLFPGRAPAGKVLLTSFLGGSRQPEVALGDDASIAATVQAELTDLLGATAAPEWIRITRWPRAIPQYTLGHLARIARLEAAERSLPGLYFCANYRGGISVGDCVKSAHAMAGRVAEALGG